MTPIGRAGSALKALGALVLPATPGPGALSGLGPGARRALRAAALGVTLAVLGGVNYALELNRLLVPPHRSLGHFWLPLLFLLLYGLCRTGWWLWSQLGPGREAEAGFPDVEEAWREAARAMARAGVDLGEAPVFLVLGRPQGSLDALFDAAEVRFPVRGEPRRDDAPVRVFAGRDAIYVACPGASILGRLSLLPPPAEPDAAGPGAVAPEGESEFLTFASLGVSIADAPAIAARALASGRGPGQYLPEELDALGRLAAAREAAGGDVGRASRADEARDKAEVELQGARLRHLARLIARDRRPYCPINGVLVLVPAAATDNDHQATRVGLLCRHDLASIREATQVRCPTYVLVCDLEGLPGFRELVGRLPDDQKRRRMGLRFPLIPDVDAPALPALIEGVPRWIAHNQMPARVDSLWRVEDAGEGSAAEAVRGNVRLYQLLHQVRERQARLARVLTRAVLTDGVPTTMLGGCYLAGTGPDARSERAFIPGVFRRLVETQDLVSWTPELLAREASYRRWARIGYVALGLMAASCLGLIAFALSLSGPSPSP